MNSARLVWPLAISLALHLCIGWLLSPGGAGYLPRSAKAVMLTVVLASIERAGSPAVSAAAPPPAAPSTTASASASAASEASGNLTQKARFLVAPDLSDLEKIAVPFSGSLALRLHVSPLGTVDQVTVIKNDPIPKELLDGLLTRFKHARLAPALAGSKAVASTLDLVIRYETAPALVPRQP